MPADQTSRIEALLTAVTAALDVQGHGSRTKLAKHLGVKPQRLNEWLQREYVPGGEHALALKEWLEHVKSMS